MAERILRFRTAAEIVSESPEEPPWICEPWVAKGSMTEVNGSPKEAGKTTLMLHMARCVLTGSQFLGQATTKGPVVSLTEERSATFREVLVRCGLSGHDDLHVLFRHDARGFDWPDVVHGAAEKCKKVGASLLIVDTFPPFVELDGDKENNAGDMLRALDPLQEAAAQGLGVVVVRHERKGGGSVSESGRGSSAFSASMDIVVSVRRPEGNSRPTIRRLQALSRFDATPGSLFIELTESGYVALGDSAAVAVSEAELEILEVAPTCESEAITEKELLKRSGAKRTTIQEAIQRLEASGLRRTGEGKRGDPYRYWRQPVSLAPEDH